MSEINACTRKTSAAVEKLYSEPEPLTCDASRPPEPPPAPPLERAQGSSAMKPLAARGKVQICSRPVDEGAPGSITRKLLAGAAKAGADHRWLKTSSKEAGMGPATGGVPQGKQFPFGQKTTLNDHGGQSLQSDASCKEVPGVDEACVNEKLKYGAATGRWLPPFNDCHDVAKQIIDACTPPPEADRQYLDSKGIP